MLLYCDTIIMKSLKTLNHPACLWSTLWPLEVWVHGLKNSGLFCVHKLSLFIYLAKDRPSQTIVAPASSVCLRNYIDPCRISGIVIGVPGQYKRRTVKVGSAQIQMYMSWVWQLKDIVKNRSKYYRSILVII